jgi:hypothetical protein
MPPSNTNNHLILPFWFPDTVGTAATGGEQEDIGNTGAPAKRRKTQVRYFFDFVSPRVHFRTDSSFTALNVILQNPDLHVIVHVCRAEACFFKTLTASGVLTDRYVYGL